MLTTDSVTAKFEDRGTAVATKKRADGTLDPEIRDHRVNHFDEKLRSKVIGQDAAVEALIGAYQVWNAGMSSPERPIYAAMLLGPTGTGKTHVSECVAEVLLGSRKALLKVDCAEFQHSHEISKLIGSPPGYLGHRETTPAITQEKLDQFQTPHVKLNIILFDEIEKANDALWQLLLGILDKARMTLGDNRVVDFSRTIVFMTSNLGATEMNKLLENGIGFKPPIAQALDINKKVDRTAADAAKKKFSPEFMNRLDKIIVFHPLSQEHMRRIMDLELNDVQDQLIANGKNFVFSCSDDAKDFLLQNGTDSKNGARPLKRAIYEHLTKKLANLVSTDQVETGDLLHIDLSKDKTKLVFRKEAAAKIG